MMELRVRHGINGMPTWIRFKKKNATCNELKYPSDKHVDSIVGAE